ncbi:uncharacterized protein LOC105386094 isoform X2 [Plutella xylostella]|uniref:uncharacterized protein LOC105386094 isoform X2 n=1 Tax=Plutella xylostella TaxID=51655 RepID=UPI0020324E2A|nr:uncharacterized protein LOC105386094 isoform X2 [Plutella xylostella]
MYNSCVLFLLLCVSLTHGNLFLEELRKKGASLKPLSACCDIPDLGDPEHLAACSSPKLQGPCNDIQCVFEKSGFLVDKQTLDKEAYRSHLRRWAEEHQGWSEAAEKAVRDCVDRDLRQYLAHPCRAYDAFTCTGIAMLKKCPEEAWKCSHKK